MGALCDKVIDKLFDLSLAQGSELIVTDVSLDDELLNRYGADIPVIKISGKVLRSPFSDEELFDSDRAKYCLESNYRRSVFEGFTKGRG